MGHIRSAASARARLSREPSGRRQMRALEATSARALNHVAFVTGVIAIASARSAVKQARTEKLHLISVNGSPIGARWRARRRAHRWRRRRICMAQRSFETGLEKPGSSQAQSQRARPIWIRSATPSGPAAVRKAASPRPDTRKHPTMLLRRSEIPLAFAGASTQGMTRGNVVTVALAEQR